MPSVKKGESEADYVKRCIPYVINKEGASPEEAAAKCHGMWKQHKEKGTQYENETNIKTYTFECSEFMNEFTLQSVLIEKTTEGKTEKVEDKDWIKFRAVAVVGDRMMRNAYVPYRALKKSIEKWNGTYHDINHMGTSYPDTNYPFRRQNIEYVVGYQSNAEANDTTKEISMDVNVLKHSPKYAAWKSFCDINSKAGKIPNVSMSVNARFRRMRVRDMDNSEINYAKLQGFKDDDVIEYLEEIFPKALTTCIEGECNAEKGCGLATNYEKEDCGCNDNCDIQQPDNANNGVVSDEDAKYLDSLKNKAQKFKDEKYLAEINEKIKKIKGGK